MYTWTHAQDATTGRIDVVLDRLTHAFAVLPSFSRVDVAVAYASLRGVELLLARAGGKRSWTSARKRFLVSMDSGFTEPDALSRLASIPGADVRVPNARVVLRRAGLRPVRPFHPKAYLVYGDSFSSPAVLVSGSANLTASALTTGAEVITDRLWLKGVPRLGTTGYAEFLTWFEEAWSLATPLAEVLDEYRGKRSRLGSRTPVPEDQDPAAVAYFPTSPTVAIQGPDAARLAVAKGFWIDAGILSRNRGPGVPGNQLDAPRGSRVYFGFTAAAVPRNHIFGDIELRFGPGVYSRHSVRFGNNQMDKINLPIPGTVGPATYDGQVLLFDRDDPARDGTPRFTITIPSRRALASRESSALAYIRRAMSSGREWGLIF